MTDHRRDPELAPFGEMTPEAREAIREERLKAAEADYTVEQATELQDELVKARRNFMYEQEAKAKRAKTIAQPLTPSNRSRLVNVITKAHAYINERRRAIFLVETALRIEIREGEETLNENLLLLFRLPDDGTHRLVMPGIWGCPGSLGTCVYDDRQDPRHDDCLVCHDPEERK